MKYSISVYGYHYIHVYQDLRFFILDSGKKEKERDFCSQLALTVAYMLFKSKGNSFGFEYTILLPRKRKK